MPESRNLFLPYGKSSLSSFMSLSLSHFVSSSVISLELHLTSHFSLQQVRGSTPLRDELLWSASKLTKTNAAKLSSHALPDGSDPFRPTQSSHPPQVPLSQNPLWVLSNHLRPKHRFFRCTLTFLTSNTTQIIIIFNATASQSNRSHRHSTDCWWQSC